MSPQSSEAPTGVWVPILNLGETPLGELAAVQANGRELVLVRQGNRIVAMDRWCPHREGDLAAGKLMGKALKCPLHGFMFSLDSGRGMNCPGLNVRVYPVQEDGGVLSVHLTEPTS